MKKRFRLALFILAAPLVILLAGSLFFQASAFYHQKDEASASAPKNGQFISLGKENIYVQELGPLEGPALLFIHGTGSWSELWKPTMKMLSELGFRCIAVDLPPFGFSFADSDSQMKFDRTTQAQRIIALLDKLNVQKVTLVGHSFGGRATLTTALLIPDRIERLILIDIALGFGDQKNMSSPAPAPQWLSFVLNNEFSLSTLASIGTYPPLTRKFVEMFVANPTSVTDDINKMYQTPLSVKGKNALMGGWLKDFLLSEDNELVQNQNLFQKISAPTYLIWGDLDTVTPFWQGEEIKNRFKNSQLHMMKNVGHIPMIEDQDAFQKLIRTILVP